MLNKTLNFIPMFFITFMVFILCVTIGSVNIPLKQTFAIISNVLVSRNYPIESKFQNIVINSRLPRVLTSYLIGVALSLAGMTMQSILKNPLADGSTLGISSGASLGAALAIFLGLNTPGLPYDGTFILAIIFSFLSLLIILSFSYFVDRQLSNSTVILTGIIFSMLTSAALNLLIVFSQNRLQSIVFWTMGSLNGSRYSDVILLFILIFFIALLIFSKVRELNAFALGEQAARNIGVNVKKERLVLFIAISVLIGISVSMTGSIPFVGLIIPHITRRIVGANHHFLVPWTIFIGGNFLMLADLMARTVASPLEIPIGVITSLIGTVTFFLIFARRRLR